jgi:hypothetical protein
VFDYLARLTYSESFIFWEGDESWKTFESASAVNGSTPPRSLDYFSTFIFNSLTYYDFF